MGLLSLPDRSRMPDCLPLIWGMEVGHGAFWNTVARGVKRTSLDERDPDLPIWEISIRSPAVLDVVRWLLCLHRRCGSLLRVFKEEAHHLAAGIRSLGFGVGPTRTSAGPGMAHPVQNPMLEHRVAAVIALDRAGIANPA